jgi:hypothetical protein
VKEKIKEKKVKMTSTFMTMHRENIHNTTTMSTYGLNYFNDACSTSDYSDGYQSSISPVASPSLGSHQNYYVDNNNYSHQNYSSPQKKYYDYQNDPQNNYYQKSSTITSNYQVDCMPNSYKLNVQIQPLSTKICESSLTTSAPEKVTKVNRFAQQFNNQHETLTKKFLEEKKTSSETIAPAPEILKRRRVAANARERRRMNNLNFAFDR